MKTIMPRTVAALANGIRYRIGAGSGGTLAFPGFTQCAWPVAGSFSNLVLWVQAPPGVGNSWTLTLEKNGVLTPLTVTITDLNVTARLTGVSVAVGEATDLLQWFVSASGTPSSVSAYFTYEFDSTNVRESGYAGTIGVDRTGFGGLWEPLGSLSADPDPFRQYAAAPGFLTSLCAADTFIGISASRGITMHIYKNGVKQDGTGGTVDTTLVLTGVAPGQILRSAFLLRVDRGDYFHVGCASFGTWTIAGWTTYGVSFVADLAGQSQFCAGDKSYFNMTDLVPTYNVPNASSGGATWVTTQQFLTKARCGVSPLCLTDLYLVCQDDPTQGARTFDLLRNDGTVIDAPGGTVSPGSLIIDDNKSISYVDGQDIGSFQHTPAGSPVVTGEIWWTLTQGCAAAPPVTRTGCPDALPVLPATGQGCNQQIAPEVV